MKLNRHGSAAVVVFIVAILVAVGVGGILAVSSTMSRINRTSGVEDIVSSSLETFERDTSEPDTITAESVDFNDANIKMMQDDDIKNIMLIGEDRREGEGRQRSDSMIICSLNIKSKKIVLTSLMRDMYVEIPGYSANKMNAAYAFGGMDLLDDVVEQDFGVKIDGNVAVDFEGFIEALSVVGNIEMELTADEAEYLNTENWADEGVTDNDTWGLTEGMNELTPEQALSFARIRHVGNSDWERTERQRRVIIAAFQKIGISDRSKMLQVANAVFPYLTTDLTNSEILSYVKTVSVDNISDIESYRIPVDGYYTSETINGMSVLVPDLTMNSQFLQSYIYGTDVDESLALSPEPASTYTGTEGTDTYQYDADSAYTYQSDTGSTDTYQSDTGGTDTYYSNSSTGGSTDTGNGQTGDYQNTGTGGSTDSQDTGDGGNSGTWDIVNPEEPADTGSGDGGTGGDAGTDNGSGAASDPVAPDASAADTAISQ